jgi:hypothetical protein
VPGITKVYIFLIIKFIKILINSIWIALSLWCASCQCEGSHDVATLAENGTTVTFSLSFYKNGVIDQLKDSSIDRVVADVPTGASKKVDYDGGRSKGVGPAINSLYGYDSPIIRFADQKKITQYGWNRTGKNSDAILSTSSRNLFNEKKYVRRTVRDEKCYLETEYTYTITQDDYLKAK